jgi:hypothetical protein
MGQKGFVLGPKCIGPGRARTQILFHSKPLTEERLNLSYSVEFKRVNSWNGKKYLCCKTYFRAENTLMPYTGLHVS